MTSFSSPVRSTTGRRLRLGLAGLGVGLLAPLAALSPSAAAPASDGIEVAPDRVASPAPEIDTRRDRIEVLKLDCAVIDRPAVTDSVADATRVHIGCRWRPAQHPRAAGYQLWRIVDRGDRELVARGGLDLLRTRDVVSSEAHLVRYAVVAVDENGRRVGQSRVVRVELDGRRPAATASPQVR